MTPALVDAAADAAVTHLQCQQCGAALQLRRFDKAVACPYCASGNVVKRPPRPGIPTPAFVVGFARPEAEVRALVARWGRALPWYAPRGFNHPQVELLRPVYLPAYLFVGEADVQWRARAGYKYTTGSGKSKKTRTEWHDLNGQARLRLFNVLVSASHQVNNAELERLEPYDYGRLARYDDAAIAGWPAEEAARTPRDVQAELTQELDAQLTRRITAMVPGEVKTPPTVGWELHDEHFDLVLVPVWTMLVRYSPTRPRVRVLVNGQTGQVWGKVPVSWVKVALAVGAVLGALLGVGHLLGWRLPW